MGQRQDRSRQHHSSPPADADGDDVALDILTLAEEEDDLEDDAASTGLCGVEHVKG